MEFEFLPTEIRAALSQLNLDKLCEIRLRAGKPVSLLYDGKNVFLTKRGISMFFEDAIFISEGEIENIVYNASDFSVYANDEKIKKGFLTTECGVRIGLAGECVFDKGQVLTIKNYTSLNIRIPHEVKGCSDLIWEKMKKNDLKNILIVSLPGYGKTTILKDLIRNLAETKQNVLVIDERGEFGSCAENPFCDIIKYAEKRYAFSYALRSLAPQVVVTDELCSEEDFDFLRDTVRNGIGVCASMHGKELKNAVRLFRGIFDGYVLLDELKIGKIKEIVCGELSLGS